MWAAWPHQAEGLARSEDGAQPGAGAEPAVCGRGREGSVPSIAQLLPPAKRHQAPGEARQFSGC